jgi:hypothetical protein
MTANDGKNAALIGALASGGSLAEAARRAHCSESTVARRLRDPVFQQQVADARRAVLAQALGILTDAATAAAQTLRALLDADADSIRLGAARAILDAAKQHVELDDIARRLEALEADIELERSAQELERQSQGRRRWGA